MTARAIVLPSGSRGGLDGRSRTLAHKDPTLGPKNITNCTTGSVDEIDGRLFLLISCLCFRDPARPSSSPCCFHAMVVRDEMLTKVLLSPALPKIDRHQQLQRQLAASPYSYGCGSPKHSRMLERLNWSSDAFNWSLNRAATELRRSAYL